jgi:hypothetical protein
MVMATWRAKCWLGSSAGYQELEVQANTLNGAKQQLERVYGAEQITNLREVRSGSSSLGSAVNSGGTVMLLAALFVIWLIVKCWWIVIPVGAILGVLYYFGVKDD